MPTLNIPSKEYIDNNFLSLQGGTLNGDLEINSGNYSCLFFGSTLGDGVSFVEGSHRKISFQSSQDGLTDNAYLNNRRYFDINNKEEEDSIVNALTLTDIVNGVKTEYIVLHTGNVFNQLDGRYVNISGDIMTGKLTIKPTSDWAQYAFYSKSGYYRAIEGDDARLRLDARDTTNTSDRRYIDLYTNTGQSNIAHALYLVQTVGGTTTTYPILHSGNYLNYPNNYISWFGDYKNEVASGTTGNNPYEGAALGATQGLYITGVYNTSNVPCTYGNMVNIIGRGTGQMLCEWTGTDNKRGRIFYRCHRDTAGGGWSDWHQVWQEGETITGAVWNDYAECRESSITKPGLVLKEKGDDTLIPTEERLSHFCGVSSDTYGFSQGETDKAKTPIAVAGRVLVYTFEPRDTFEPGDCVCAGPGGTVSKMTRQEIIEWPDRIVGKVSCVPDYEIWGGGEGADREPVKVDGRIWIQVK